MTLPAGWQAWHDLECATIVSPGDIGALQVSAHFKESDVLEADLRSFASEHLEAGARLTATRAGEFAGFELAFSADDRFWRQWYLGNGTQMLLITYNCDLDSRGADDEAIRESLLSLEAKGP